MQKTGDDGGKGMAMQKTVTFTNDPHLDYLVECRFPFDKDLVAEIKRIPGREWQPVKRCWLIPIETRFAVTSRAEELGMRVDDKTRFVRRHVVMDGRLHDYQNNAIGRAVVSGRWIFNDEMGLGKTPQAICAARELGAKRILVICPAVVRYNWRVEFKKWWEKRYQEVGLITVGRKTSIAKKRQAARDAAYASPIQVVSYNLLTQVEAKGWDVIILDEAHRLKNPGSIQSLHAKALCQINSKAAVFALTATLMPNHPLDCWNVVDTLWPGRFGKSKNNDKPDWLFCNRYSTFVRNEYGGVFDGVNDLHIDELRRRLEVFSSRTTKSDVAHLLPPFDVRRLELEAEENSAYKLAYEMGVEKAKEAFAESGKEKHKAIVEWVKDASENCSHVCVLTHLKETARAIAKEFRHAVLITGEIPPEQRNKVLAEAKDSPCAVVVATMHSVGIGIDLTFCPQALFAELYYRPETMVQAMGRFSRLSGTVPSSVNLMVLRGTLDEVIANRLDEKITAINLAIRAGLSEEKLGESLKSGGDWMSQIEGVDWDAMEDGMFE